MKKIIFILLTIFFLQTICYAANTIDLHEFSNEIKKYGNELFPELQDGNILSNVIKGNIGIDGESFFKRILNIFFGEFKESIILIFKILGISILCGILKNIQNSFGEDGVSEVAFYVCYILIILLVISSFTNIIQICRETITTLNNFMRILIPIIIALLLATGNITTVAILQPVLLAMTSIISSLVSNIIIPIIFISTIINIVSNISPQVNLAKLSSFLRKTSVLIIEITLTIFIGVLSLEGSLASSVDGITAKTAKTVVSTAVPVAGKLLGDAVDSVIGRNSNY